MRSFGLVLEIFILCGRCHSFLSELLTWPLTIGGPNAFSFSESGLCFVVRQKGKFGFLKKL